MQAKHAQLNVQHNMSEPVVNLDLGKHRGTTPRAGYKRLISYAASDWLFMREKRDAILFITNLFALNTMFYAS